MKFSIAFFQLKLTFFFFSFSQLLFPSSSSAISFVTSTVRREIKASPSVTYLLCFLALTNVFCTFTCDRRRRKKEQKSLRANSWFHTPQRILLAYPSSEEMLNVNVEKSLLASFFFLFFSFPLEKAERGIRAALPLSDC